MYILQWIRQEKLSATKRDFESFIQRISGTTVEFKKSEFYRRADVIPYYTKITRCFVQCVRRINKWVRIKLR